MRVQPQHGDTSVPGGEPLDRTDVRAAAAAEHQRPHREVGGDGERLHRERLLLDHRHFGVVERERRRLHHRLSAVTPGARHPHESGGEGPTAAVALVAFIDRHGGERPAVGASRTQEAHSIAFSNATPDVSTLMPTRS